MDTRTTYSRAADSNTNLDDIARGETEVRAEVEGDAGAHVQGNGRVVPARVDVLKGHPLADPVLVERDFAVISARARAGRAGFLSMAAIWRLRTYTREHDFAVSSERVRAGQGFEHGDSLRTQEVRKRKCAPTLPERARDVQGQWSLWRQRAYTIVQKRDSAPTRRPSVVNEGKR